jgi:hypothetical protein
MSINCGELDCKENAVWTDRCGCVFCKKHKWRNHGGVKKLVDITSKSAKFYSARSNDYLEGFERGRKQSAVEELKDELAWLERGLEYAYVFAKGETQQIFQQRKDRIEKRLKELSGVEK